MSEAIRSLRAAAKACSANAHGEVLTCLLAAWATMPASEIAVAVEVVSPHAARDRRPPCARTQAEARKAWMRRARAKHPADMHHLLPLLVEAPNAEILRRVELLGSQAPDPRVTGSLARLAAAPPFDGPKTLCFWAAVHRLLREHPDPRTRATLERDLPALPAGRTRKPTPDQQLIHLRHATIEALRARPPISRTRAEARICRELCHTICEQLARVVAPVRERLFAEVFAHPHDRDRRRVLADYLLEHGDPRGEFITLQLLPGELDAPQRRRQRELMRGHGREWLGPLGSVLVRDSVAFEGGFPARGRISSACRDILRVVGDPHWATIEELDGPAEIVTHPMLRSLRHLRCPVEALLTMFSDELRRPTIESIDVEPNAGDESSLARLRELGPRDVGLPNLRSLRLRGGDPRPEAWTWIWRAGGLGHLQELELGLEHCDPRAWIAQLQADAPSLAGVTLHTWTLDLVLTHVEPGDWRRMHARGTSYLREYVLEGPMGYRDEREELRALAATPLLLDDLEIDRSLARLPEFASALSAGIIAVAPDAWG